METRERLLFIALGGLLVLAGMRLGYLAQYRLRIPVLRPEGSGRLGLGMEMVSLMTN